jgi:hypothetical protein
MNEHGPGLDPFTADALLDGDALVAGTPLADMLDNLKEVGMSNELSGELAAVEAMAVVMGASTATAVPRPRRRMTARAVALAATGTLAFSGVAAAAGLPVPIVSDVFSPERAPSLADVEDPRDDLANEQGAVTDDTGAEIEAGGDDVTARDGDAEARDETHSDAGSGSSALARSDCGKPDVDPTDVDQSVDADCDEATNHGKFVSEGAKESKRGEAAQEGANVGSDTKSESGRSSGAKGASDHRAGGKDDGKGR